MAFYGYSGPLWNGGSLPPRMQWRIAQVAARRWDRWYPRWWDDSAFTEDLLSHMTERYGRIWVELIRQRRGH